MSADETYRSADLFSGAGGVRVGTEQAGFETVVAVDYDEQALQTQVENFGGNVTLHDLGDVDPSALPDEARGVDYLHGSPPCQGFSNAKSVRDPDDERNEHVWNFIEWVDELQPKVVTVENVAGMATISSHFMDKVIGEGREPAEQQTLTGDVAREQTETRGFASIGYEARWKTLNAADYGVPQTRERIFVVAVREDVETPSAWFPSPTHRQSERVSVREAIGDLAGDITRHKNGGAGSPASPRDATSPSHTVSGANNHLIQTDGGLRLTDQINETHQRDGRRPLQRGDQPANTIRAGTPPLIFNHVEQDHDAETRKKFAAVEPGETTQGMSNRRLEADSPSPTITADEGAAVPPIHYAGPVWNHVPADPEEHENETWDGARRLTVRECARLQSFPDWFVFAGHKTGQYAQVGNAVPPRLQYHIASHVKKILRGAA